MTLTQARLIIYNPRAYTREQVKKAAAFILAAFEATCEDLDTATFLL